MAIGEKKSVVMAAEKGAPNGVAALGADGRLTDSQRNAADVSAGQKVSAAGTIPARTISCTLAQLQATLDALPKLVTEAVTINVTGNHTGTVEISGFYGPGSLTVRGSGWPTLTGRVKIQNVYLFCQLRLLRVEGDPGVRDYTGLVAAINSGYVNVMSCKLQGIYDGSSASKYQSGISVSQASRVHVYNCNIRDSGYAAAFVSEASVLNITNYDNTEVYENNFYGIFANGGITGLSGPPNELGSVSGNVKYGGLIVSSGGQPV